LKDKIDIPTWFVMSKIANYSKIIFQSFAQTMILLYWYFAGLATVGGVCSEKYSCIIAEFGSTDALGKPYPSAGFTSVYILAHEIGHRYLNYTFLFKLKSFLIRTRSYYYYFYMRDHATGQKLPKSTVSRVVRKPFAVVRSGLNENLIILCRSRRRHRNNSHRVLITPIRRRQGRREKANPSRRA